MRYIKVAWKHDLSSEPVLLYSEINDERWEIRKVEMFKDGSIGRADAKSQSLSTRLGLVPLPDFNDIAADRQFVPSEISRQEFEEVWLQAKPLID